MPSAIFAFLFVMAGLLDTFIVPVLFIIFVLSTVLYALYYTTRKWKAQSLKNLKSDDKTLRKAAVIDVANNRLHDAEDALINIMLNDLEPDISLEAYFSLLKLGKPQYERLTRALGEEQEECTRLNIIRVLRAKAGVEQAGPLTGVYPREQSLNVKREILNSLKTFKAEDIKKFYFEALRSESNAGFRRMIIEALADYKDNSLITPLIGALREEKDANCRLALVKMLDGYNDRAVVEPLIDVALHDTNTPVRCEAIRILDKIDDIRAVEPLMSLLKDPGHEVRDAAAKSLHVLNAMPPAYAKEVVREIVKVPCKYCGTLVDVTHDHCGSCGAPLKV